MRRMSIPYARIPADIEGKSIAAHSVNSAREASRGFIQAQLMTNTHVLEVIVREDRENDPAVLNSLFRNLSRASY